MPSFQSFLSLHLMGISTASAAAGVARIAAASFDAAAAGLTVGGLTGLLIGGGGMLAARAQRAASTASAQ